MIPNGWVSKYINSVLWMLHNKHAMSFVHCGSNDRELMETCKSHLFLLANKTRPQVFNFCLHTQNNY